MSEMNIWNSGDPFALEQVEDSIARSLSADAPATPTAVLVRSLADAYALPPAVDAVLARSRASLARRAEALGGETRQTGGQQVVSTDSRPAAARFSIRPPQPSRRRVSPLETAWRMAAAVLVVALLSAGFFALLHGMQRPSAHPTPTPTIALTTIPNFTTMTFAQAQATAQQDHLQVTENDVPSTLQQKGYVISQAPQANQQVPWNTYVTLDVGAGPATVTIPDLRHQSLSDAENQLVQLGLKINTLVLQPDPTVPSGDVIKSNPPAGTSVAPGSAITLYVSTGLPQPTPTVTPPPQPTAAQVVMPSRGTRRWWGV